MRSKSGKYFCSKSCQTLWRNTVYSGEKNKNWINGIRTYRNILIKSGVPPACFLCKIADARVLCVHHRDHQRTNNNVRNLIWLCFNCHYLVHHDKQIDQKIKAFLL